MLSAKQENLAMTDPNEDEIEKRARMLFEAEEQENHYWDEDSVRRTALAPHILTETDKKSYRDRARDLLIAELKSMR
jgi:hypothetical protein